MLNLFKRNKQLLDEEIIEWIFDCFAWTLEEFDQDVFVNETILVVPDNKHFPGKETSADGMASLIFDQVKSYASMTHWPTQLYDLEASNGKMPLNQGIIIDGALRGKNAQAQVAVKNNSAPSDISATHRNISPYTAMPQSSFPQPSIPADNIFQSSIAFGYHPQQLKSPEGVIAYFAHGLSYHLVGTAKSLPPGGSDYVPMAGEITGIFMGFGIMFANSAVVARAGGCGGCGGGQSPVRQVFLNEDEATYALAVFCHLKSIDNSKVTRHLKKHLRGLFKASYKDSKRRLRDHRLLKISS